MSVTADHIAQVQVALPDAEIKLASGSQELIDAEFNADILICWTTGGHFIAEDYCQYASRLKWIRPMSDEAIRSALP